MMKLEHQGYSGYCQRQLQFISAIYFCNLFIGIRILPSKLGLAGLDLMVTPRFCFLFFFFFFILAEEGFESWWVYYCSVSGQSIDRERTAV